MRCGAITVRSKESSPVGVGNTVDVNEPTKLITTSTFNDGNEDAR